MTVCKDNGNDATLLQYAVQIIATSEDPQLKPGLQLPDELAPLRHAKIKIDDVRSSLSILASEARELENAACGGGDGSNTSSVDPFAMRMRRFAEHSTAENTRLTMLVGDLEVKYVDLCKWLKIKMPFPAAGRVLKPPTDSDELFGMFVEFADAIKLALPKPKPAARQPAALVAGRQCSASNLVASDAPHQPTKRDSNGLETDSRFGKRVNLTPDAIADPMMSRMSRISVAPSANLAATGDVVTRPAVAVSQARLAKRQSVDRRLQERLAARFEKTKSGKADLGAFGGDS